MSESLELDDDVRVVIDGDGVEIEREYDTDGTLLSWEQFGDLADWLGYVPVHKYDKAQQFLDTLGNATIDRIDLDDMNPQEVDAVIMEILGGEHTGSPVVLRTDRGAELAGRILSSLPNPPEMNIGGAGETRYTTPVEVAVGPADVDGITFTGTHVYERETRDHPGYDAIEEVGVEIDGDFQRVEYVEVVA